MKQRKLCPRFKIDDVIEYSPTMPMNMFKDRPQWTVRLVDIPNQVFHLFRKKGTRGVQKRELRFVDQAKYWLLNVDREDQPPKYPGYLHENL